MRVLLSAYACEPNRGSEPAVGWNVACALAQDHDVWVLTRANNREVIERETRAREGSWPRFVYFDLPSYVSWWKRGPRGVQLYYHLWQLAAWKKGMSLQREIGFDIVQHLTFARYWTPAPIGLIGPPFVWGPVGGGDRVPSPLVRSFSWRGRLRNRARMLGRRLGELDPLVRACARRATVALGTTEETADRLRSLNAKRVQILPAVALSDDDLQVLSPPENRRGRRINILSVGTLASLKGFHLGIEAFGRADIQDAHYTIVGGGPERERLDSLIQRLDLGSRVRLGGELPREQVFRLMSECDVFLHPSLQDSGGMVCLEAMAAAKPVICMKLGGPEQLTDPSCALRVLPTDIDQTIEGLAEALRTLGTDENLRTRLGCAGRRRVHERFRWRLTAQAISEVYTAALEFDRQSANNAIGRGTDAAGRH